MAISLIGWAARREATMPKTGRRLTSEEIHEITARAHASRERARKLLERVMSARERERPALRLIRGGEEES